MKQYSKTHIGRSVGIACIGSMIAAGAGNVHAASTASDKALDKAVWMALKNCETHTSCHDAVHSAKGVLVFPSVVKADLIVGGSGGKGALVQEGKITGYYSIGAGSAGLQAGIDDASQVYAFQKMDALDKLKSGQDWNVGASSNVTLVGADANAAASTASVDAFVYDAKGLHAGVSVNVFDVWKTGAPRPKI